MASKAVNPAGADGLLNGNPGFFVKQIADRDRLLNLCFRVHVHHARGDQQGHAACERPKARKSMAWTPRCMAKPLTKEFDHGGKIGCSEFSSPALQVSCCFARRRSAPRPRISGHRQPMSSRTSWSISQPTCTFRLSWTAPATDSPPSPTSA